MEFKTNSKSLLALVLVLALLCEPTFAKLIRIPLTKVTTEKAGKQGQAVTSYYTPVAIGTPGVKFNLQFEIAMGSTFVPHKEPSLFRPYLKYGNGFRCKKSKTCSKVDFKLTIEYQQCSLTGKLYEDLFTFGTALVSSDGLLSSSGYGATVRQNFLAISDASSRVFKDLPIDGFIGLAPRSIDNSKVNNIVHSLKEAKLIDKLQFSFTFNRNGGAELTLGGYESNRPTGQSNWHSLATTSANIWALNLRHVSLGHQIIACDNDCEVSFSSALNEVYGPRSAIEQIYSYLSVSNPRPSETLTLIDCRRIDSNILPILTFTIEATQYKLFPKDYIKKDPVNETCYIAILPNEGKEKQWTLGTNFLESYYSVFDISKSRIGFARPNE